MNSFPLRSALYCLSVQSEREKPLVLGSSHPANGAAEDGERKADRFNSSRRCQRRFTNLEFSVGSCDVSSPFDSLRVFSYRGFCFGVSPYKMKDSATVFNYLCFNI